jgi:hypothetical protein
VSPVKPRVALDGEDAVLFSDAIVAHLLLSVNWIAVAAELMQPSLREANNERIAGALKLGKDGTGVLPIGVVPNFTGSPWLFTRLLH